MAAVDLEEIGVDAVREALAEAAIAGDPRIDQLQQSIEDQAALHGVLEHIESLGLELVEVRQVDERRESVARDTRR